MPSRSRKSRKSKTKSSRTRKSRARKSRSQKLLSSRKMWDVAWNWGIKPKTNSQKDILAALKRAKVPASFYTRK